MAKPCYFLTPSRLKFYDNGYRLLMLNTNKKNDLLPVRENLGIHFLQIANIVEAAKGIAAWFPGSLHERFLLEEQLESTIGVNNLALRDATKNSKCDSRQQGRVVVVDGVGGTRTVADGMEKIEGVTLEESRRKEE
ncbi:hypothetical protein Tco_0708279 [Tanacetum coccineum]